MLPSGVLVPRALAGRSHAPVGFPAAKPLGTPAPAPAQASNRLHFPPPLALESGPSAWTDESRAASLQPPTSTPGFGQPPSHYASPPPPAPAFGGPPSGQPGGYPGAGEPPGRAGSLGAAAAFGGAAGLGAAAAYGGAAGGLGAAAAGLGGAAGNVGGRHGGDLGSGSGSSTNGANGGRGLPAWADLTGATPSDTPPPSGGPVRPGPVAAASARQPVGRPAVRPAHPAAARLARCLGSRPGRSGHARWAARRGGIDPADAANRLRRPGWTTELRGSGHAARLRGRPPGSGRAVGPRWSAAHPPAVVAAGRRAGRARAGDPGPAVVVARHDLRAARMRGDVAAGMTPDFAIAGSPTT